MMFAGTKVPRVFISQRYKENATEKQLIPLTSQILFPDLDFLPQNTLMIDLSSPPVATSDWQTHDPCISLESELSEHHLFQLLHLFLYIWGAKKMYT